MWADKIKTFFRPKPKIETKITPAAEKKPVKPESLLKKQRRKRIIVSQKVH